MIPPVSGKKTPTKSPFVLCGFCISILLVACSTPGGLSTPVAYSKITGQSVSGPFLIQRMELSFSRGAASITVNKGQQIIPSAKIKYQGRGVLSAKWMVDDVVIEQVNATLNQGSLLTLSPRSNTNIPSFIPGLHILRLQINQPETSFKLPELTYFVVNK